jgi:hypothetical protein
MADVKPLGVGLGCVRMSAPRGKADALTIPASRFFDPEKTSAAADRLGGATQALGGTCNAADNEELI